MVRNTSPSPPTLAIRSPNSCSTASGEGNFQAESWTAPTKKGTRRSGSPSIQFPRSLFQMVREVLVHFEHADPILAPEDRLKRRVCNNFPFVLRILQVVLADVIPNLGHHLAARQWRASGDLGEVRRRLNRASQSAPCFTTSLFCHQALLLFLPS